MIGRCMLPCHPGPNTPRMGVFPRSACDARRERYSAAPLPGLIRCEETSVIARVQLTPEGDVPAVRRAQRRKMCADLLKDPQIG